MKQRLRAYYHRQMFFPTWMGLLLNPFYFARANLASAMRSGAPQLSGQLLDVGCGSMPYRELFDVQRYVGLDIDTPESRARGVADCLYDGTTFPLESARFDAVVCNQVLEHVFNPEEFLGEIARVLKPGGRLLLTVPFVWDEHEQPHDFARYTSFGLRHLLEGNGFRVVQQHKLGADASVLAQLANAYVFKVSRRLWKPLRAALAMPLVAVINLGGQAARYLLPGNPDLYLDQMVLAEKKT
jgi:SAM-dependent methyltransferase